MFIKVSLVLLFLWILGILGLYNAGSLVHILLLVGLMLLLIGGLKARDAAVNRHKSNHGA